MVHVEEITSLLGGPGVLGQPLKSDMNCIELIRKGLPFSAVTSTSKVLDLSEEQVLIALGIPKRTAARRKSMKGRLNSVESERVLRLGRAIAAAADVLGSREKAADWIRSKLPALDGSSPLDLLDTDVGLQRVLDILTRIEYGVYS
jgi:putative toxin-antitoxin system antitoxin component (TIGR02293 family)